MGFRCSYERQNVFPGALEPYHSRTLNKFPSCDINMQWSLVRRHHQRHLGLAPRQSPLYHADILNSVPHHPLPQVKYSKATNSKQKKWPGKWLAMGR